MKIIKMKHCNKCDCDKDESEMVRRTIKPLVYHTICKNCQNKYAGKYRALNKDKIKKGIKKWYDKKGKKWKKKYDTKNLERTRIRDRKRYHEDEQYRMIKIIRSRNQKILKRKFKNSTTMDFVACTKEFFVKWIESNFTSKMNWKNHGKYWELDHVIPCSFFDLSDIYDVHVCINWKNLCPLKKETNRKKSNKIWKKFVNNHYEKSYDFFEKYYFHKVPS